MIVEILFHDTPTTYTHLDARTVIHGLSAVTVHFDDGTTVTYPWCNVQRVKQLPVQSKKDSS